MQVYKYNEKTKEYTNTETAMLDPLETELQGKEIYLLPANATFTAPSLKDGFCPVWDGEQWQLVEDNRRKQYWLPSDKYGTPGHEMKELGAMPAGATFTAPEKPAPTVAEIQKQLTEAVQNYMDTTVQARNYDNINSACTYANSTDHIFAAEGVACVKWRDAVWRKCYDMLAEVKAGTRAIPTAEEVIAELPALEW